MTFIGSVFVLCYVDSDCSEKQFMRGDFNGSVFFLAARPHRTHDFNTDLFEWDTSVLMYSILTSCADVRTKK